MLRALTREEIAFVGGGDGTEPVDGGEIVVTGTRMTNNQILAYDMSYARASNEIWSLGAFGAGAIGYLSTFGGAGAVGANLLAYALGTSMDEATVQQLTNDLTEAYYDADGADGTYDGVSGADRASPYPY